MPVGIIVVGPSRRAAINPIKLLVNSISLHPDPRYLTSMIFGQVVD